MQPWISTYNHSRPHSAVGGQPTVTRLNNVLGFDTSRRSATLCRTTLAHRPLR